MFETTDTALREFLYERGIGINGFDKRRNPEVVAYLDTLELRAAIREYEKGRTTKRSLNRDETIVATAQELLAAIRPQLKCVLGRADGVLRSKREPSRVNRVKIESGGLGPNGDLYRRFVDSLNGD